MVTMASHIHQALEEIRVLKQRILEKQKFKGYSGRARAMGGCFALMGGILGSGLPPFHDPQHLLVLWIVVAALAGIVNFGALFFWFFQNAEDDRHWRHLKPVFPIFLILWAGVCFTVGLNETGQHQLLYGAWMTLYGLGYFLSLHVLPPGIARVGLFYLLAGGFMLLFPPPFTGGAWVMGLVFFTGEWWAGFVFHFDGTSDQRFGQFFGVPPEGP